MATHNRYIDTCRNINKPKWNQMLFTTIYKLFFKWRITLSNFNPWIHPYPLAKKHFSLVFLLEFSSHKHYNEIWHQTICLICSISRSLNKTLPKQDTKAICYCRLTINWNIGFPSIESLCPDDIKGGYTKQSLLIICSSLLENFSSNRNSGVHRIAYHVNKSLIPKIKIFSIQSKSYYKRLQDIICNIKQDMHTTTFWFTKSYNSSGWEKNSYQPLNSTINHYKGWKSHINYRYGKIIIYKWLQTSVYKQLA